jgi:hypothetical protein
MTLSEKQRGVLRGMAIGALAAVLLIVLGVVLNPFGYRPDVTISERLSIALKASAFLCLFLAVSVGRLAKHRFFTPEDIDGGGLTMGSDRAKLLQSILQNTLEQSVLAAFVYLSRDSPDTGSTAATVLSLSPRSKSSRHERVVSDPAGCVSAAADVSPSRRGC